MKKTYLICMPYAGGLSYVFDEWKSYINENIEVCPIEYPGRGKRVYTPFYNDMNEAAEDIYKLTEKIIYDNDFALFGHSLGGALAYEFYYKILESCNKEPSHLFISGKLPPHSKEVPAGTHSLPEKEFMTILKKLGGTSEAFFQTRELVEYFLPILRADFKIIEQYKPDEKNKKVGCPTTVMFGSNDNMSHENAAQWGAYIDGKMDICELAGDHFFIHSHKNDVVRIINKALAV